MTSFDLFYTFLLIGLAIILVVYTIKLKGLYRGVFLNVNSLPVGDVCRSRQIRPKWS